MPTLTSRIQDFSAKWPFFGFLGVGAISTVIDFVVSHGAVILHVPDTYAAVLGFLAGLVNGYLLNSALVFNSGRTASNSSKYVITSLGGLLIRIGIVQVLDVRTHLLPFSLTWLIAVGVVFVWNYVLSKYWAFKA